MVGAAAHAADDYPWAGRASAHRAAGADRGARARAPPPPRARPRARAAPGTGRRAAASPAAPAPSSTRSPATSTTPEDRTDLREPRVVDRRLDRRPLGLCVAQLHELRLLAPPRAQRHGGLRQPLPRRALGQRGQLGRRRPPPRLPGRLVPAIGAVAQTDAGRVGHVAWVSAIGPGTVTIEEYNYGSAGGYGTRTVPVGDFRYLHLDDVAAPPFVGSDRPVVSVPDGLGGSWTARVDGRGTLLRPPPASRSGWSGARRAFTPVVAPALMLDARAAPGWPPPRATAGSWPVRRAVARLVLRPVAPRRPPRARPSPAPAPADPCSRRSPQRAPSSPGASPATAVDPDPPRSVGRLPGPPTPHPSSARRHGRAWLVAVGSRGSTFAQALERGRLAATPRTRGVAHLDARPDHRRRRHHPTPPGHRGGRLGVRTLDGGRWSRPTALAGGGPRTSHPLSGGGRGLHVAATDGPAPPS